MAKAKSKDPEIRIKAKNIDGDKWKEWSKKMDSKGGNSNHASGGALYFVGFIGALVYNMQAAVGFGAVVTGILKALVWPAYIVYKLLEMFYGVVV